MLASRLSSWVAGLWLTLYAVLGNAATVAYTPTLLQGWNLVGNSTTAALDVKTLLGTQASSVTSVWKWNAANSKWAFYSPALDTANTLASYAAAKGYDVLSSIDPGDGFWINVNATSGLVLGAQSGTGFALGASTLKTNWNLVATGDDITPALFTTTVGNVTTLWAWNNANSGWYFYAPSAAANGSLAGYISSKNYQDFGSTTLGNGRGFWVNYAGSGTGGTGGTASIWNPSSAPLSFGSALYILATNFGAMSDQITVHFAGGVSSVGILGAGLFSVTIPLGAQNGLFTVTNNTTGATLTSSTALALTVVTPTCTSYNNVNTPVPMTGSAATSWTDCSAQSPAGQQVVWGNNTFVAAGGGSTKSSTDGFVWSNSTTTFDRVAYNGLRWIGVKINSSSSLLIGHTADATPAVWTTQTVTLNRPGVLTGAYAANGRFFVGTNNGSFLTSTDGSTWTETAGLCDTSYLSSVYAGNVNQVIWNGSSFQMYVGGVGLSNGFTSYPTSCTSTDGVNWTSGSLSYTGGSAFVPEVYAFDGTKYVASQGSAIWTSADGLAWLKSGITAPAFKQMIWTGDQFIGLSGQVYTSTDGLVWTNQTLPTEFQLVDSSLAYSPELKRAILIGQFAQNGWYLTAKGAALFVLYQTPPPAAPMSALLPPATVSATASGGSIINLTWSAVVGAAGYDVYRASTAGQPVASMSKIASIRITSKLVGGNQVDQLLTTYSDTGLAGASTYYYKVVAVVDAITSTAASAEASASTSISWTNRIGAVTQVHLNGITWSGTQYLAVGGTQRIYSSPDGMTWTLRSSGTQKLNRVIWSGSQFVAVGGNPVGGTTTILTSPDGVSWTPQPLTGVTGSLSAVAWSGSLFVAVGSGNAGNGILTSPDGVTWTAQTSTNTGYLSDVIWTGSQFIAYGNDATLTSPDGVVWTAATVTSPGFSAITYGAGKFVGVGGLGIFTSTDALSWTAQVSGTQKTLRDVTWTGELFAAAGDAGTLLTSPDGITWTTYPAPTSQNLAGIASNGSQLIAVGYQSTIVSAP